jgi:O-antigen/teichoic acid export membrane protein
MNPLKQLASQTAIYGLSSIVARIVNFFLVPLYTRMLPTGNYGLASELLAYIALFQVVLTFGMETGFFRFATKHKEDSGVIFSTALISLGLSSVSFLILVILFSTQLSALTGHPVIYILYVAGILAIDCFTAILFAQMRQENRPWKFAAFRTIKIATEIVFNLLLFFLMPAYLSSHPESFLLRFMPAHADYSYILVAILMSCIVSFLLFIPKLIRTAYHFSKTHLKLLLNYSIPLMIAGLPGVANDFISRIFFRFFAPSTSPWQDQLGIFNANIKLAVFMVLFVQMFRYAAEPFFFSSANKEGMKKLYADVMKYFVAFCLFIFLGIALYKDVFALILGKDYRSGINVLPIMLVANVLLGITFNLSMWYKLSEHTRFAVYITLSGLAVNLLINVLFMPLYGDMAASWGYLLSYLTMVLISNALGRKYYPIPYDWKAICLYFGVALAIFAFSWYVHFPAVWISMVTNTILLAVFGLFILRREKVSSEMISSMIKRPVTLRKH